MAWARAAVLACMLCGAAAAHPAAPTPGPDERAFQAAEQRLAAGDTAGAVDAFVAVADQMPRSPWADDALAEAARGAEQLDDLRRATALWRRVAEQYPSSRQARRAEARLAELVQMIGSGGEWADVAAAHQRILRAAAGSAAPIGSIIAMEALVDAQPSYPRATAARVWIGDALGRAGLADDAERWYRAAAASATAPIDRWRADKALADAMVAHGRFDDAEIEYARLRGKAGHLEDVALDEALDTLAIARGRRWRARAAAAFLVLLFAAGLASLRRDAGSWRAALRALARPPTEVLYAAPVALLLALLAWKNDALVGSVVAWIAAGAIAIAWWSGALLVALRARTGRVGLARAGLHAVCGVAAALAVAYLAIVHGGLMDMLVETWRHGHDR